VHFEVSQFSAVSLGGLKDSFSLEEEVLAAHQSLDCYLELVLGLAWYPHML